MPWGREAAELEREGLVLSHQPDLASAFSCKWIAVGVFASVVLGMS